MKYFITYKLLNICLNAIMIVKLTKTPFLYNIIIIVS